MKQNLIKINLVPAIELENPNWYMPDIISAFVLAAVFYLGTQFLLQEKVNQIEKMNAERDNWKRELDKIKPELEPYAGLEEKMKQLQEKFESLKGITSSKVSRYHSLMVLDYLQALKPDGVWFESLKPGIQQSLSSAGPFMGPVSLVSSLSPASGELSKAAKDCKDLGKSCPIQFTLIGYAFDHVLIAEFISALKATETKDFDHADLRTQIQFASVTLRESIISAAAQGPEEATKAQHPRFVLIIESSEKEKPIEPKKISFKSSVYEFTPSF